MTNWIDKDGPHQQPSGWHEVTVQQFCDLAKQATPTREGAASLFAGRPIQINVILADALSWLNTEPPTEGGLYHPANLGQETYLQVELIRKAVNAGKITSWLPAVFGYFNARQPARSEAFRQDVALSLAEQCLVFPITDVYPAVAHCLAELKRLNTKYAELGVECTCEGCAAAKSAGTQEIQALSFFNTLDALAEKMGTTVDAVGQMPYDTVALQLLRASRLHTLQARVHQAQKQS